MEHVKQFQHGRKQYNINADFGDDQSVANLIQLCLSYKEAVYNNGGFNRFNEPLLIIP